MHSGPLKLSAYAALFLVVTGALPRDRQDLAAARVEPVQPKENSAPAIPALPKLAEIEERSETDARMAFVESALTALSGKVAEQSHPDALRYAFQAYYNFKRAHPDQVRNPYFYFVDYGLDSGTPRGYVFDMEALELVEGPFTVAHGRGSASRREGVPVKFSNRYGSAATSLGLYRTQETYAFSGTAGGQRYRSIGLRMMGLSGRFNSGALTRGVVVHGAPYVTADGAGRSEGCPAMEQSRARRLIPLIDNGSLVFLFSPLDGSWLREDPWVHGTARRGRMAQG